MPALDVFVGRQPIFDRTLRVFAYELLFRGSAGNSAGHLDGDQATSQVVLNTFLEIGLDRIVGSKRAFINLTRSFIVGHYSLSFPEKQVVLEVLEDIEVDEPLITALRDLSAQGYLIALDDFVFREALRPLVEIADIIKIDLRALDQATLRQQVTELRRYPVKLLAEKVETQEEMEFCRRLGFDYFQGYFLCRPNIIKGQRMPANRVAILHLLTRVQDPQVDIEELDCIIRQDVALSYRLLRYINSAFFALPRKIESIHQAVVYLGPPAIKTWATLIALSEINDKPNELMTTALVRAKLCEGLAATMGWKARENFFTVGLLSALDALLDIPMPQALATLPLSEDTTAALLHYEGPMGAALHCTLAYEQSDWETVATSIFDPQVVRQAYLDAIEWADHASRELVHR